MALARVFVRISTKEDTRRTHPGQLVLRNDAVALDMPGAPRSPLTQHASLRGQLAMTLINVSASKTMCIRRRSTIYLPRGLS
jgi:hypothetical protein